MIKSVKVGKGRLNESGVWKNPDTQAYERVSTSMVQATGVGTSVLRLQLPLDQTILDNKDSFSLAWECTDILTAKEGYEVEALDEATLDMYSLQAHPLQEGQYIIRIDCVDKPWWWLELELHVEM